MTIFEFFTLPLNELLFQFCIPFLVSFALMFGVLEGMKLFKKKINFVIALAATLAFANSPLFLTFSQLISSYGAFLVFASFIAVFALAGIIRGGKRLGAEAELMELEKKIGEKEFELKQLLQLGKEKEAEQVAKELEELRKKREGLKKITG